MEKPSNNEKQLNFEKQIKQETEKMPTVEDLRRQRENL